jgi:ATP-dependent DNA helicase RecG
MKEYNLSDLVFKQEALHGVVVCVRFMNNQETHKRATDRDVGVHFGVDIWRTLQQHEIKIATYAFHSGEIQVSEAQRIAGRTWGISKKDLERLTRRGLLVFIPGQYPRNPKATYKLVKIPPPPPHIPDS